MTADDNMLLTESNYASSGMPDRQSLCGYIQRQNFHKLTYFYTRVTKCPPRGHELQIIHFNIIITKNLVEMVNSTGKNLRVGNS